MGFRFWFILSCRIGYESEDFRVNTWAILPGRILATLWLKWIVSWMRLIAFGLLHKPSILFWCMFMVWPLVFLSKYFSNLISQHSYLPHTRRIFTAGLKKCWSTQFGGIYKNRFLTLIPEVYTPRACN